VLDSGRRAVRMQSSPTPRRAAKHGLQGAAELVEAPVVLVLAESQVLAPLRGQPKMSVSCGFRLLPTAGSPAPSFAREPVEAAVVLVLAEECLSATRCLVPPFTLTEVQGTPLHPTAMQLTSDSQSDELPKMSFRLGQCRCGSWALSGCSSG